MLLCPAGGVKCDTPSADIRVKESCRDRDMYKMTLTTNKETGVTISSPWVHEGTCVGPHTCHLDENGKAYCEIPLYTDNSRREIGEDLE